MDNPQVLNQGQTKHVEHISSLSLEPATESNSIQIPQNSLPKGGGPLKGIDEKFEVNSANGSAGFSITSPVSPGRKGFFPALSLSYNSGGGNSRYDLGWSVGYPMIQRKTYKKLPTNWNGLEKDVFMFSWLDKGKLRSAARISSRNTFHLCSVRRKGPQLGR